jgi:hypothetical protein
VSRTNSFTVSLSLLLFAGSCAEGMSSLPRHCRGIEPNGPELTGVNMARMPAPGCPLVEGIQLRVTDLGQGVTLAGGETLRDVKVEAGTLKSGARPINDFVGATLLGTSEKDLQVLLKIDAIAPGDDRNGGVPQYTLSYLWRDDAGDKPSEKSNFRPLCKDNGTAIAVAGHWDLTVGPGGGGKKSSLPTEVTFACKGSAVAKCVTVLEYKPWSNSSSGVPLEKLHESCVRAVRADYCGNGQSNTRNDEKINFYDSAGVQRDAASWPLEAIWSADGARCVEATRLVEVAADPRTKRKKTRVRDYIAKTCPQILHECPKAAAGPADSPALLYTEIAPSSR